MGPTVQKVNFLYIVCKEHWLQELSAEGFHTCRRELLLQSICTENVFTLFIITKRGVVLAPML